VGSLSSSFKASTGSASNTITLNGTALNIKQTTNTTWGPGAVPTLSSTIQDGGSPGSVALDATSTGTLSFSGPNTYSGGTTLNGGTLIAANTSGSATGSGPVAVSGGSLGGSGSVSGAVTVTNGALLPGTPVGTSHIGGTLTTGALALNGGSMTFNLNTPASSDSITASTLSVGGAVSININNLGALGAATYHLINYGGSLGGSFGNLTLGSQPAGFSFSLQNNANHVDLLVTAANANVWTAATDTNWDTSTPNWTGAGSLFVPGDSVVFDDTANGVSPLSVSIPADVSPGLVTFNNNSKSYTVGGAGKIAGNANLVVAGTGSVTLTSQNSFTGAVAIAGGGMLSISADNQLGNANNGVSLTSSVPAQLSTLQVSSTYTSARSLTLYSLGGAVDVTGANTLTLTGAIAGGGGLTKSNTGTLVLTGTGSYTGATNVTGGSLKLGAAAVSPALSALTIASGATVDTVTFNNSAGSLAGAGNLAIGTAATFSAGFNNSSTLFSGVISGTGTFAKTGTGTLTLTGVANNVTSAGAFSVSGGGKLIAAQGGLGTATAAPTIALSGASTLQFSTPYTYTTQVVNMGGNGIIDLGSNAATLSFLSGTGVLTVQNGPSLKLVNSPSSTAAANTGGVVVGNGTDGGVVLDVAGAVTGSGIPAIGTGIVTVNQNSTFWLDNIKDGFNSTTGLPTGTGNGAITFKANSTWKATGSTIYSGGSPTIDTGATVTISVPTSTDQLVDNTAIRNPATGNQQDTTNAINVTGNGLLQIGSGGVSATSSNQFGGTWTIGTASTSPRVVLNAIKGGFGETLNAFGYAAGSPAGAGSPVTMVSGTLAFGADAPNPSASSPLAGANSFRSPLVLQGGSIASTGQEYDVPASTTTAGAQFNAAANAAVSANLAGDITLAGTVNALTYDPIGAAPTVGRNLNFTNDVSVSSASFTWNAGATLAVTAGSSTGGAINFARTAGTVTFNSGAALNISANSTVNVGKQFTAGSYTGATFNPGSLQNVAGVVDPFTDSSATGNDTTQSVSATISGTLDYAAQAAAAGTRTYRLGATAITNGLLKLDAAASVADRTILVVGNLTFSGAGSMDLGRGEILTTTAASDVRTAVLNGKITTSSSDPAIGAIAIGYKDLGGGITEARYTLKGDANLSGNVDVGDLGVLATNYGITGGQVWSTGDFSGDGTVDVADLGALATNYNATLGGAGSGSSATLAAAPLAVLAGASSAVPEPTSMGLLALGATSLLARRRRRLA